MKKILVVDSDPEALLEMKVILTSHGFDVLTDSECLKVAELVISFSY